VTRLSAFRETNATPPPHPVLDAFEACWATMSSPSPFKPNTPEARSPPEKADVSDQTDPPGELVVVRFILYSSRILFLISYRMLHPRQRLRQNLPPRTLPWRSRLALHSHPVLHIPITKTLFTCSAQPLRIAEPTRPVSEFESISTLYGTLAVPHPLESGNG
jgi:hypothetical protein